MVDGLLLFACGWLGLTLLVLVGLSTVFWISRFGFCSVVLVWWIWLGLLIDTV